MIRYLFFLFLSAIVLPLSAQSSDFPGRKIYPMVKTYDTQQLNKSFNDVVVVDVRSRFEFQTLHINGAKNIPLNDKNFAQQISDLAGEGKPVVFYCNGHKCYHSYRAYIKAKKAGITNMFAYDSGIFDWTRAHPEKATLMGQSPVNLDQLISKEKLKQHLLEPEKFLGKVEKSSIILDIREPAQRGLLELFPYRQQNISLREKKKLDGLLSSLSGRQNKKTLMVYDEGGTQVRWLQYHLEQTGVKNYYFMSGGIKQYFEDIRS